MTAPRRDRSSAGRAWRTSALPLLGVALLAVAVASCGTPTSAPSTTGPPTTAPAPAEPPTSAPTADESLVPDVPPAPDVGPEAPAAPEPEPEPGSGSDSAPQPHLLPPRPEWLGTRVLAVADDGRPERPPTPDELRDRRFSPLPIPHPTPEGPPGDGSFRGTSGPVPSDVLARSTWHAGCPVDADELRYLTVTFVGFDDRTHTGELLAHADVADDLLQVFAALHAARFPLEDVRVISPEELVAPPTGDGNVTTVFVCRMTVGGSRWSEHAFGRAIDLNPFHNPYVRGSVVIPELSGVYTDRDDVRPGMIVAGDAVTAAFAAIGWGWGGAWTGAATDPMHFSVTGR